MIISAPPRMAARIFFGASLKALSLNANPSRRHPPGGKHSKSYDIRVCLRGIFFSANDQSFVQRDPIAVRQKAPPATKQRELCVI